MDKEITLQYIGYTRKSSEDNKERQAASLPEQLYILEGIKSKHNLRVIEILQESKSAHKQGRELFNTMLERIDKGEANALLVWHVNRLARNMIDGGRIIDLLDRGKLIEIRTSSRIYRNSPEDKFMLSLEFSISKKDSDDKAIVVERGLEKKARDGWRPGVAPEGYLNDKTTESGFRKILSDPERLPFIKKIFQLFYDGTSANEIYRIAKDEWKYKTRQKKRLGGKPLAIGMIYWILNNPFYCGKFEYPIGSGKWYEGKHEKTISEEIFDAVQRMLGNKSQYKNPRHHFAYSAGLMRCGNCQSAIVAEEKFQIICSVCKGKFSLTKKKRDRCTHCSTLIDNMKNPTRLHYIYYRCGKKTDPFCTQKSVRLDRLEQQIDEKLSQVEISPLFMDWAIRQIHKMNDDERDFREDEIEAIKRTHDECRRKLDNLLQLKISPANTDGSMLNDEDYKAQKEKLEKELKDIEKQLSNTDNRMLQANEDTAKAFTFVARAKEKFANGDLKKKRDIFNGLGLNLTLKDRIVNFDSPKYLLKIKEMKNDTPIIGERVAPKDWIDKSTEMEDLYSSIPSLLRGWYRNQTVRL